MNTGAKRVEHAVEPMHAATAGRDNLCGAAVRWQRYALVVLAPN